LQIDSGEINATVDDNDMVFFHERPAVHDQSRVIDDKMNRIKTLSGHLEHLNRTLACSSVFLTKVFLGCVTVADIYPGKEGAFGA
jgi:hypothetical protein